MDAGAVLGNLRKGVRVEMSSKMEYRIPASDLLKATQLMESMSGPDSLIYLVCEPGKLTLQSESGSGFSVEITQSKPS